jgi:AAA domain
MPRLRPLLTAPHPPPRPMSAAELLAADVEERKTIVAPLIGSETLNLLYGPRGLGKTYVAMGIAWAAASGTSFLGWQASGRHRVVYVDGEMALIDMKKRLAALGAAPDTLEFILSDRGAENRLADLAERAGHASLLGALGELPDLLVLDNLSSLAGFRSGDPDPWLKLQRFLLTLRRTGIAVLIVHHANKRGGQRGSSHREDLLDLVLALRRPTDYEPSQGARFELHVEKARGLAGPALEPIEARLSLDPDGHADWDWRPVDEQDLHRVAALLRQGLNPNQIARELGISKSKAYRLREQIAATEPRA